MAIFSGLAAVQLPPQPLFLAVGMFDGVHCGHQSVINAARAAAESAGGLSGVLTFWPHPSRLFRPDTATKMIYGREDRRQILRRLGIDFVIEQPFDREFSAIEAEELVKHLRARLPTLHSLYVGENWRFGRGRRGNVTLLKQIAPAENVAVESAERLTIHGEPVSSTRIRELISAGDMEVANELLGYPYFCRGTVVPGRRLGNVIGFPTLNLDWVPDLRPAFGVYAVRVQGDDADGAVDGVANYGVKPTVDDAETPVLEVHLLGGSLFSSGDRLLVQWLKFLRPEARFASIDELKAQIGRDRDEAVEYFRGLRREDAGSRA